MFSLSQMKKIKQVYLKIVGLANDENITAIVSEMERFGAMVSLYDKYDGDNIYKLNDKTWNRLCKIENRKTAEFTKFKQELHNIYNYIIYTYISSTDKNYDAIMEFCNIVIKLAKNNDKRAYEYANRLIPILKKYSYKHGSDFGYYISGFDDTNASDYKKLADLTKNYSSTVLNMINKQFHEKL